MSTASRRTHRYSGPDHCAYCGSPSTAPRRWLDQAESAAYLGVTDRTIRNYIARGDLTGRRVRGSRLIRIDVADLDRLLLPIPSAKSGGAE